MNLVVLCSVPNAEVADAIAHAVVTESLAACVNILPTMTSVYRWEGEVTTDSEQLLVIKTREERYDALERRIVELHPYEVPEVIALPIDRGSKSYVDWITAST